MKTNSLFKKLTAVFMVMSFMVMMTMSVFAETLSANGHTVVKQGANCVIDGTTYNCTGNATANANDVSIKIGSNTFECTQAEATAIRNAINTAPAGPSSQSLQGIRDQAVNEVESLQQSLGNFTPNIATGLGALGSDVTALIQKTLSIGVGILWIVYLAVLIINGAAILVPGFFDKAGGSSNMNFGPGGNQSKGSGFLSKFIWKSTTRIITGDSESPIKEFIKATIPSMIFMVILTVCLFNGLLIKVITFFLKFFNFN